MSMLESILKTESIAVVGASPKEGKIGRLVVENLLRAGFKGKIYPVNPRYSEILGLKTYPSLRDIPGKVDLVVVAVPAEAVPNVVDDAVDKGVDVVVVLSAGFSEAGKKDLEEEILRRARRGGVRIIGPNCAGISIPSIGLHASFEEVFSPGSVALLGQSGAYLTALAEILSQRGVGVSFYASLGNRVDVGEEELMDMLLEHDETKVIVLYIEGLRKGQGSELLKIGSKITLYKPVIVHKAGWSSAGARAALSHTGSLAGSYHVYLAAFKQAGFIIVDDLDIMVDVAEALSWNKSLPNGMPVILTNSGGHGVTIADHLEATGIKVPELPSKLKETIGKLLPPHASLSNPIDMLAEGTPEKYAEILDILLNNDEVGAIIVVHNPPPMINAVKVAEAIVKVWNEHNRDKPLITFFAGFNISDAVRYLRERKVPVTMTHRGCAKAVSSLYEYSRTIRKKRIG